MITLLIGGLGAPEILLVALVVLLLFGGRKIPELMKGLGKGIREFNNAKANIESEINEGMREIDSAPKKQEKPVEKEKVSLKEEDAIDENKSV